MLCEVAPPKLAHENYSPGNSSGHLRTLIRFGVGFASGEPFPPAAGPRIQNLPKFSPPLFSPRQRPRIFLFSPAFAPPLQQRPPGTKGGATRRADRLLPSKGGTKENSDHLLCGDRDDPVPAESDAFLVVLRRGYDDDERAAGLIEGRPTGGDDGEQRHV